MAQQWNVTTEAERSNFIKFVQQIELGQTFSWKRWREKRTNPANALFHVWCATAADHFNIQAASGMKPPEVMKMCFKDMFLGREDVYLTDKKVIPGQLKQTSKLDVSEFCQFMERIQSWCAMRGCALPVPGESEYAEWLSEQEQC